MTESENTRRKWWQEATGYQIWPASFKDSNNDGMGDLNGITSSLDYLKDLGVDLIWLSPIYDSPQHDMGYDIRNYEAVWPKYGSVKDMEHLIGETKKCDMKILMDLVVNHTSSEHGWFLDSSSSRTSDKSDWYIWRDPRVDANGNKIEPNNWKAAFGGSVWTYVPEREQYYLHLALPEQPDLNWQNSATRQAIYDSAVNFWLKRGIDGFRVDVVNFWWKDPEFPDAKVTIPGDAYQRMEAQHIMNGADVHIWLKELRSKIAASYGEDILLIGETPATGRDEVLKYISSDSAELDMIFAFDILVAGNDYVMPLHERKDLCLPLVKEAIAGLQDYQSANGKTWTTAFLESHDFPRSVSHLGPGEGKFYHAAAKTLALLTTTLSGTIFIYQGQEIGMTNIPEHWTRNHLRDEASFRYLDEMAEKFSGDEDMQRRALQAVFRHGRDSVRTPLQWSPEAFAGFSTVEPWMPVNDNYSAINASDQGKQEGSVLNFWKKMLQLRKRHLDLFIRGKFRLLDDQDMFGFSFMKQSDSTQDLLLVLLNFSYRKIEVKVPEGFRLNDLQLLVKTDSESGEDFHRSLDPWTGRAYLIESDGALRSELSKDTAS